MITCYSPRTSVTKMIKTQLLTLTWNERKSVIRRHYYPNYTNTTIEVTPVPVFILNQRSENNKYIRLFVHSP